MTRSPENAGDPGELQFRVDPSTGEIVDDVDHGAGRRHVQGPPSSIAERIDRLEAAHGHLHQALSAVLDRLEADTGSAEHPVPSRWSWHHLSEQDRARLWAELPSFVDWLIERYQPDGSARIPACWYLHPVAVEELTALMVAWRYAYCARRRRHRRALRVARTSAVAHTRQARRARTMAPVHDPHTRTLRVHCADLYS